MGVKGYFWLGSAGKITSQVDGAVQCAPSGDSLVRVCDQTSGREGMAKSSFGNDSRRALTLISFAVLLFGIKGAQVKYLTQTVPIFQIA